jgi:hypothetical protein
MVKRNARTFKQDIKQLSKLRRHSLTSGGVTCNISKLSRAKKVNKADNVVPGNNKVIPDEKSMHMDKGLIKDLIQEERLGEAGKILISFGHKDLGTAFSKFSEVLPYISPGQYTKVLNALNGIIDKEYDISVREAKDKAEVEGNKSKEDLTSFNRLKDAMVHYTDVKHEENTQKQEEQNKCKEERKQKDINDMASLFKSSKFKPLPATIGLSVIQGDIVIIGKVNNIERAIGDDYNIHRLSYTEAIIKDVSLLGIREDRLLIPSLISKHKKGIKRAGYLVDREKKARKKLITLESLSRMVERVMGKIMPAMHKWYILGLD